MPNVAVEDWVAVIPTGIHPGGERLFVVSPIMVKRDAVFNDHPTKVVLYHVSLLDAKESERFKQGSLPVKTGLSRTGNQQCSGADIELLSRWSSTVVCERLIERIPQRKPSAETYVSQGFDRGRCPGITNCAIEGGRCYLAEAYRRQEQDQN